MLNLRNKHTIDRERILAEGIEQVVAELRLVEVVDYIAFLRMERLGNVADIVNSSSQLFLKTGTLRFGGEGDVHLAWGGVPTIDLAMEFHHRGVSAHFRLGLAASSASVTITFIAFENPDASPEDQTEMLRAAVKAARIGRAGVA
ncbi:hypothetical protein [Aureimonas sp. SA4125]|uniref:hypothetical protein n=1 Tax=Aureimonas sp. SA4125 TaxID=2826993 RepID=UPI001CC81487|nr:hypothetical protein [Aureimonas sp. SA4125]